MIIELKNKFLSYATTKDQDVIEIMNAGELQSQKSKFGGEDMIAVFKVKQNGKEATFSLYEKYKKPLIDAWGNETNNWIGKKFTIFHLNEKMEIRPMLVQTQ